jgi:hypothetical protein
MRRRTMMANAYEDGKSDAKYGLPPDAAYSSEGRYREWRYAYDAGYYTSAAKQYREGMVENADLYAKAIAFMTPEQREAFLFEMWSSQSARVTSTIPPPPADRPDSGYDLKAPNGREF